MSSIRSGHVRLALVCASSFQALLATGCPDGAAAEGEGEDEDPLCGSAVCDGDVDIATADDARAATRCRVVAGNLTIAAPDLEDLDELRCLEEVGGNLVIGGDAQINEPVEEPVTLGPARLTSLRGLSSLTSVGGELLIGGSYRVFANVLPDASVTAGPSSLTTLDGLDALEEVGSLSIRLELLGNPTRTTGALPLEDLSALDASS